MQRDESFLLDIFNAAKTARQFCDKLNKQKFFDNTLVQSGVLHQLIIMGEAVKLLSAQFRKSHSQIPWKLIAGMRDRITHGYFEIDLNEVWNTVEKDLPVLIEYIKPLIQTLK